MRSSISIVSIVLVIGCAVGDSAESPPEPLVIGPTPVLEIGVTEGDTRLEFNRAIGMRRLPDGRIVVADGSSRELRWYAADGGHLLSTGRSGNGPGEFRGGVSIFPGPGDSLMTYDSGLHRLMLFSGDGAFGRVVASGSDVTRDFAWAPWVYRRSVVLGAPLGSVRGCTIAALDVMPLPPEAAAMRMIVVDELGRLWVREADPAGVRWTVWRRDGVLLGEAPLPERFDPAHIGADFILGRGYAEDDTERIRVLALRDDRDPGACLSETAVRQSDNQPRPEVITTTIRNLITGQEAAYAELTGYTSDPARIPITIPEPLLVRFFRADTRGWAGAIVDPVSGFSCAISVGDNFPGGWIDGMIICG